MITDKINNNLNAVFDIENDDIFKALICDKDGTIAGTVNLPTDINIGALASQIEYLRQLSISLVNQIYIDEASSVFLTYILNNFFDSLQYESETDQEWISRTIATVLKPKVSRATIIYALRPYSTLEPEIENIETQNAYSDYSYSSIFVSDLDQLVLAAIAEDYDNALFMIKITLYDTETSKLNIIYELLSIMLGAGIDYVLVIKASA